MIKSMTGFGRGVYQENCKKIDIEIKSVNHRYHDINIKMPKSINYLEEYINKRMNEVISRGKIDINVNYTNLSNKDKIVNIDENLVKNYISVLKNIAKETDLADTISITDIIKFPDVVTVIDNQDEEELKNNLEIALGRAIEDFLKMRIREGTKIATDLQNRLEVISKSLEKISELSTGLVDEYVVKLKNRIKEIIKDNIIDENRIAMEAVIYADKISIEEEIIRLHSHILQFNSMLLEEGPSGKKLDFLIQEMNREINTIASKANCLDITKQVVELKNELENIREQIQNIE